MPIFGFLKSARKKDEEEDGRILFDAERRIALDLGDDDVNIFVDGVWCRKTDSRSGKENQAGSRKSEMLKTRIQELEEENNMLRLKQEVLLNMLTHMTAEQRSKLKQQQSRRS